MGNGGQNNASATGLGRNNGLSIRTSPLMKGNMLDNKQAQSATSLNMTPKSLNGQ